MNLTVRAERQSLWLCFEPWATEHTLLPGTAVVIRFADGTALEIHSEWMPNTPTEVSAEMFRALLGVMPPIRSDPAP